MIEENNNNNDNNIICPKCGNNDNFHYNYDYNEKELPIINILCNECGEFFEIKNNIINIMKDLKDFIGLTAEDGYKLCKNYNYDYRVVRKNDINFVITCDFHENRVNFEIDNELITKAYFG